MAKDILSFQIFSAINTQPGLNVLHFRTVDDGPDPDPDSLAKAIITAWIATMEDLWLATFPATVALIGYKCRRVNNGGGPTVVLPRNENGARTGGMSATGIGPCIIWGYQKSTGGWAAGRTFVPGVSETDIENNRLTDDLLSALDDFITPMLNSPALPMSGTGGADFVIYSPTHTSASGVETGGVSGKPGVQNKRMKPSF